MACVSAALLLKLWLHQALSCSISIDTGFWLQEPYVDPQGMLLFDYLVHEGYWDTASKVAQDILLGRVQVSEQVAYTFHPWSLENRELCTLYEHSVLRDAVAVQVRSLPC